MTPEVWWILRLDVILVSTVGAIHGLPPLSSLSEDLGHCEPISVADAAGSNNYIIATLAILSSVLY